MNPRSAASVWRLELAEEISETLAQDRSVRAISVVGSVSEGFADGHSDLDLVVYRQSPLVDDSAAEGLERIGATRTGWRAEVDGALTTEQFQLGELKVDVRHETLRAVEILLGQVLDEGRYEMGHRSRMVDLVQHIPLQGRSWLDRWRSRAQAYPDALVQSNIEAKLPFYPLSLFKKFIVDRGNLLHGYMRLCQLEESILDVLLAVNRRHGGLGEGKTIARTLGRLTLAPENLASRMEEILLTPPEEVFSLLDGLVLETLKLAERHAPGIDIAEARRLYAFPSAVCPSPPTEIQGWLTPSPRPTETSPITPASVWRLDLARALAVRYARNSDVKAASVVGSVARGDSDDSSDLDLLVYWDQPDVATIADRPLADAGVSPFLVDWSEGGSVCLEQYLIGDLRVDVFHCTAGWCSELIADVQVRSELDAQKQVQMWYFLNSLPLYGAPFMEALRSRALNFPDGLARTMVRYHLSFRPLGELELAVDRGNLLRFYRLVCEYELNVHGVLLGLNRLYGHPWVGSLQETLMAQMEIAPNRLSQRFKDILRAEPPDAIAQLDRLVRETLGLVEQHMPEVPSQQAWTRYESRVAPVPAPPR